MEMKGAYLVFLPELTRIAVKGDRVVSSYATQRIKIQHAYNLVASVLVILIRTSGNLSYTPRRILIRQVATHSTVYL